MAINRVAITDKNFLKYYLLILIELKIIFIFKDNIILLFKNLNK